MSQGLPESGCLAMNLRTKSAASALSTSLWFRSTRQRSRFALISSHICCERSTNVARLAPRESASMPTAPEPAQRSRKRASAMRGAMTLKSVSRSRSEVGRTSSDGGLFRFRPRYCPAMILKSKNCFEFRVSGTGFLLGPEFRLPTTPNGCESRREPGTLNPKRETLNLKLSYGRQAKARIGTHSFNQLRGLR